MNLHRTHNELFRAFVTNFQEARFRRLLPFANADRRAPLAYLVLRLATARAHAGLLHLMCTESNLEPVVPNPFDKKNNKKFIDISRVNETRVMNALCIRNDYKKLEQHLLTSPLFGSFLSMVSLVQRVATRALPLAPIVFVGWPSLDQWLAAHEGCAVMEYETGTGVYVEKESYKLKGEDVLEEDRDKWFREGGRACAQCRKHVRSKN